MAGLLSRALDRRTREERDADELQQDSAEAGCGLISACNNRSMVTIHGELRSVTLRPIDGVPALEAEIYDGSAAVTLVWLGRRRIEGIRAGTRLSAYGRIGRRGNERIIYNPRYELDA
jgi:hypothetical protein